MWAEVGPSVCPAGTGFKMEEPDQLSFNVETFSRQTRGEEDVTATCFSCQVKKTVSVESTLQRMFHSTCHSHVIHLLILDSQIFHFKHISWVTQCRRALAPLPPGDCPGAATERTQSSWRTSWHDRKRISGELKERRGFLWKRSNSLRASVTSTWRATAFIHTGGRWTLLLLEIRGHERLNSARIIKSTTQREDPVSCDVWRGNCKRSLRCSCNMRGLS